MAEFQRSSRPRVAQGVAHGAAQGGVLSADINEGLRAHMNRVYGIMATGLGLTALVAYMVGTIEPLQTFFFQSGFMVRMAVALGPLGLILYMSFRFQKMSVRALTMSFYAVAGLIGASFGALAMMATSNPAFALMVGQALGVTAVSFLALSMYGYTTKKDLSGWGSFLFIGLVGIIVASLVNIFLQSEMMQFVISCIGILIFAGLTAYDTQRIKNEYLELAQYGGEAAEYLGKAAVMGALGLYLNFVNMFQFILSLFMSFGE